MRLADLFAKLYKNIPLIIEDIMFCGTAVDDITNVTAYRLFEAAQLINLILVELIISGRLFIAVPPLTFAITPPVNNGLPVLEPVPVSVVPDNRVLFLIS